MQCPNRPAVEPAGGPQSVVALEAGECLTGTAAEIAVDPAPIIAQLPEAELRTIFDPVPAAVFMVAAPIRRALRCRCPRTGFGKTCGKKENG